MHLIATTNLLYVTAADFWNSKNETFSSNKNSRSVTTSVAFEKLIRKVAKSIPETFFAYKQQLCSQGVSALVGINSAY